MDNRWRFARIIIINILAARGPTVKVGTAIRGGKIKQKKIKKSVDHLQRRRRRNRTNRRTKKRWIDETENG